MSDRLSTSTDDQLERALTRLGSGMGPAEGTGLLDRVEEELLGTAAPRGPRLNWPRLAVAALALAVAGVGTLLAVRAFGPEAPPQRVLPGDTPTTQPPPPPPPQTDAFTAVWPELSRAEAEQTQAAVDGGDPDLQWRLDPDQVARRVVEDEGYNHPVVSVREVPDVLVKDGRLYDVTTDNGEAHRVLIVQLVRQDEGGIWSVTDVRSRLELTSMNITAEGATTVIGRGAPAGAQIGYHLHRACPPDTGGCAYTQELHSVNAEADGTFRIEDDFPNWNRGWSGQPGVFTVWVIEMSNERTLFGPITMRWLPPGDFTTG